MKAKYLVQRTNYKGQILYYNAQKWGQVGLKEETH